MRYCINSLSLQLEPDGAGSQGRKRRRTGAGAYARRETSPGGPRDTGTVVGVERINAHRRRQWQLAATVGGVLGVAIATLLLSPHSGGVVAHDDAGDGLPAHRAGGGAGRRPRGRARHRRGGARLPALLLRAARSRLRRRGHAERRQPGRVRARRADGLPRRRVADGGAPARRARRRCGRLACSASRPRSRARSPPRPSTTSRSARAASCCGADAGMVALPADDGTAVELVATFGFTDEEVGALAALPALAADADRRGHPARRAGLPRGGPARAALPRERRPRRADRLGAAARRRSHARRARLPLRARPRLRRRRARVRRDAGRAVRLRARARARVRRRAPRRAARSACWRRSASSSRARSSRTPRCARSPTSSCRRSPTSASSTSSRARRCAASSSSTPIPRCRRRRA